ncbi:hypothetical protein [Labedaea rhizosphaerae]|uniref:Tetratricopeptide repeat protein n=1 Tax=Labedaea rhizosphaerae TaxID=598644 RepID=A0A4R6RSX2_LABRH|nr:hypothetical protein [Labedaea rhizosphaerae]TDP89989.1 hypothetical protein EV186_111115 [Labedaea rhizosphaerae]
MTGVRLRLVRLGGVRAVTQFGRRRVLAGDLPGAAAAFGLAAGSGHARYRLRAALHLWVLHARQGDSFRSGTALREAVRLAAVAERCSIGDACVHIGSVLADKRPSLPGVGEAVMAFRETINSGDLDLAPKAALGLAVLRWRFGAAEDDVRAAFRLAVNSRHPDVAPTAERLLALFDR